MRSLIHFVAVLTFCFSLSVAEAQNKVVVIPMGGAVGDAVPSDVVKGKTFSSDAGKGLTGTLVLPPGAQTFTNIIGMTFNLIPAGTFTMGSPADEPGREPNETQHQVTLTKPFYMAVTEVTNKQWNNLIVATGLGDNPSLSHTGDNYPVENVNWYEAAAFANYLSAAAGLTPCYNGNFTCTGRMGDDFTCTTVTINPNCTGYRLPTEAQWEYAARASTTTAYANPYSFDATNTVTDVGFNSNLAAMGWYFWNNTISGYTGGTKPVAQKQANRWGLYDMHGNVYDWCQDWYADYPAGSAVDPLGSTDGSGRVVRGGCYVSIAGGARSAYRFNYTPGYRNSILGFRLALPPGQ